MRVKVTEYVGEINKIGEFLDYEFRIDSDSPDFKERFLKEREKAVLRRLEMKRRIRKEIL